MYVMSSVAFELSDPREAEEDYYEKRARDTYARAQQALGAELVAGLCELALLLAKQSGTIDFAAFSRELEGLRN